MNDHHHQKSTDYPGSGDHVNNLRGGGILEPQYARNAAKLFQGLITAQTQQ